MKNIICPLCNKDLEIFSSNLQNNRSYHFTEPHKNCRFKINFGTNSKKNEIDSYSIKLFDDEKIITIISRKFEYKNTQFYIYYIPLLQEEIIFNYDDFTELDLNNISKIINKFLKLIPFK